MYPAIEVYFLYSDLQCLQLICINTEFVDIDDFWYHIIRGSMWNSYILFRVPTNHIYFKDRTISWNGCWGIKNFQWCISEISLLPRYAKALLLFVYLSLCPPVHRLLSVLPLYKPWYLMQILKWDQLGMMKGWIHVRLFLHWILVSIRWFMQVMFMLGVYQEVYGAGGSGIQVFGRPRAGTKPAPNPSWISRRTGRGRLGGCVNINTIFWCIWIPTTK